MCVGVGVSAVTNKVLLVIIRVCVWGGGGGGGNVFQVIGWGGGGGGCDTVSLVILCVVREEGGCNKVSLVIVYVSIMWVGGAVVGSDTVPLVLGGGGGVQSSCQKKKKKKKTLHKSHDTPAHDGVPHTKFGYERLSTDAQPTGNKYLSHALQPSPPKTPQ